MGPTSDNRKAIYVACLRSLLFSSLALILLIGIEVVVQGGTPSRDLPINVAFAIAGGVGFFVVNYLNKETPFRNEVIESLRGSFFWFPPTVGLASFPFWYWFAISAKEEIQGPFFEVSAQVIPVLLLAIMIDVRPSDKLQTSDLTITIVGLIVGESVALRGAASGGGDAFQYATICTMLTLGFFALIVAVIVESPPSAKEADKTIAKGALNSDVHQRELPEEKLSDD